MSDESTPFEQLAWQKKDDVLKSEWRSEPAPNERSAHMVGQKLVNQLFDHIQELFEWAEGDYTIRHDTFVYRGWYWVRAEVRWKPRKLPFGIHGRRTPKGNIYWKNFWLWTVYFYDFHHGRKLKIYFDR